MSTALQGQTDLLRRPRTALATLPVRGLVTLGPALPADAFAPSPNVVVTEFVPHARVFPHVAAIVSQCGHGTVMKALAHGIPLVCLPLFGDQPEVAARVVHAGAGVRLSRDAPSTHIRTAIRRVLQEPQFREGAQRLATMMALEGGVKTAVEELESVVPSTRDA